MKIFLYRVRVLFRTPGPWKGLTEIHGYNVPDDFFQAQKVGRFTWVEYKCLNGKTEVSSLSPAAIWETRIKWVTVTAAAIAAAWGTYLRHWS